MSREAAVDLTQPMQRIEEFSCCYQGGSLRAGFRSGLGRADHSSFPGRHIPRLKQLCHQAGPAGLMGCTDATSIVAVEILMEQDVVLEVRIGRELRMIFQYGTLTIVTPKEQFR